MSNHFSTVQRLGFVLVVVAVAAVGLAAIGGAQTADFSTNETATLTNDSKPINVSVTWNESISDPANTSATVVFEHETAAANEGNVTDDLDGDTLNGTLLEVSEVYPNATYTVHLENSTAGSVSFDSSAFENGSVDVSAQTADSVQADDTVTSLDVVANTVFEDSLAADAGNTTTSSYNETDGALEFGNDYRVTITGPDSAIDSASVSDNSGLLGGVVSGTPLEGGGLLIGGAVIGLAVIGAAVYTMRD